MKERSRLPYLSYHVGLDDTALIDT